MNPHPPRDNAQECELHQAVKKAIEGISDQDRAGLIYGVINRAAKFFQYCPEDFCIQHACWFEGHAVFGGTNRLLWSVERGLYPDQDYCTPKFLEQFAEELWEKIGQVDIRCKEMVLVDPALLNLEAREILPRVRVPIAWNGSLTIFGRKSKKGDGKIAEVRFNTGAEA